MPKLTEKSVSLKRLWFFLKPHKAPMMLVLVSMTVAGLLESLNLAAIYPIINYGLNLESDNISFKIFNGLIDKIPSENSFMASCVVLIILTVITTIAKILHHYLGNKLVMKIVRKNQSAIFEKLKTANYLFFVKNQQGKLIYAGTVAPLAVSHSMFYLVRMSNSVMTVILLGGLLLLLSWQGTALVGLVGLCYVIFIRRITTQVVKKFAHLSVPFFRHLRYSRSHSIDHIQFSYPA